MAATPAWQVKLQRAREHVGTFEDAVYSFLATGAYSLREEVVDGGQAHVLCLVERGGPPPRLSAIVGDVLHNTRSALDCLVYAFASAGPELTEREAQRPRFPISDTDREFKRERKHSLHYVNDQAVETIRSMQPFCHVGNEPLAVLRRLSNIDKHRRLHLTACFPGLISAGIPEGVSADWRSTPQPWHDGDEVVRLVLPADQVGADLDIHSQANIRLEEDTDLPYLPAINRLRGVLHHVDSWVVPILEQQLP